MSGKHAFALTTLLDYGMIIKHKKTANGLIKVFTNDKLVED
ncbi:hypothetical protein [Clostridium chromiireducens]|nr:hypothetical protein [Clostridium chromiireducens]